MGIQFSPISENRIDVDQAKPPDLTGAYALGVLCWLLSAGVYIAVKAVAKEVPPWTLCFWRAFLAGLILFPVLCVHRSAVAGIVRRRFFALLVIGGLGFSIAQGLMYTGLNYTSAMNAGLIFALMPVITMILARFLLNEPLGLQQAAGAIVAIFGMAIIVVRGDLSALLRLQVNPGELLIVLSAVSFAIYTVLLRKAKFDLPRLPLLILLLEGGAIVALPFYIWEIAHDDRTTLNMRGLFALAYTVAPGGALVYYLFNRSVDVLGASKAGVLLYLQTVFVAILAFIFLGERLEPYHFGGAAFICAGVLLITCFKPRSRHEGGILKKQLS